MGLRSARSLWPGGWNETISSPVLVVANSPHQAADISHELHLAGIPAISTASRDIAIHWARSVIIRAAVIALDVHWAPLLVQTLATHDVPAVGVSDDEVAQLRALRGGFIEVFASWRSPAFSLSILTLMDSREDISAPKDPPETGPLRLDCRTRTAYWRKDCLRLSKAEFELLEFLACQTNTVIPKDRIMRHFRWQQENSLHQLIWHLRRAMGDEAGAHIVNRHGFGYGYMSHLDDDANADLAPINAG